MTPRQIDGQDVPVSDRCPGFRHGDNEAMTEYVVIDTKGRHDYYEGQHHALYRDGALIWEGFSNDKLPEILNALGIDFVRREGPNTLDTPERIDGGESA